MTLIKSNSSYTPPFFKCASRTTPQGASSIGLALYIRCPFDVLMGEFQCDVAMNILTALCLLTVGYIKLITFPEKFDKFISLVCNVHLTMEFVLVVNRDVRCSWNRTLNK